MSSKKVRYLTAGPGDTCALYEGSNSSDEWLVECSVATAASWAGSVARQVSCGGTSAASRCGAISWTGSSLSVASVAVTTRTPTSEMDASFWPRQPRIDATLTFASAVIKPSLFIGVPPWATGIKLDPMPEEIFSGAFKWGGSCVGIQTPLTIVKPNPRPAGKNLKLNAGSFHGLPDPDILDLGNTGVYTGPTPGIFSFDALPGLTKIRSLELSGNGLKALMPASTTLINIPYNGASYLDLYANDNLFESANNFSAALSQVVGKQSTLDARVVFVTLQLNNNKLMTLKKGNSFASCFERVQRLQLNNNQLSFIEEDPFSASATPSLSMLQTAGNRLQEACPSGYYNKVVTFTTKAGTSVVYDASGQAVPGSFATGGKSYLCPAGRYSNAYLASNIPTCLKLSTRDYSQLEGRTRVGCISCNAGTASNITAANKESSCRACERGYYSNVPGLGSCLPCSAGRYGSGLAVDQESIICPTIHHQPALKGSTIHHQGRRG
jgi:hypothetical protein